jgi:hypothetical protein
MTFYERHHELYRSSDSEEKKLRHRDLIVQLASWEAFPDPHLSLSDRLPMDLEPYRLDSSRYEDYAAPLCGKVASCDM